MIFQIYIYYVVSDCSLLPNNSKLLPPPLYIMYQKYGLHSGRVEANFGWGYRVNARNLILQNWYTFSNFYFTNPPKDRGTLVSTPGTPSSALPVFLKAFLPKVNWISEPSGIVSNSQGSLIKTLLERRTNLFTVRYLCSNSFKTWRSWSVADEELLITS